MSQPDDALYSLDVVLRIRISEPTRKRLYALAEAEERPVAWVARRAIEDAVRPDRDARTVALRRPT